MHCGCVVSVLTAGAEGPGFKTSLSARFFETLSLHPAVNGWLTLFRAEEGEGDEKKGLRLTSFTLSVPVQVGSLTAISLTAIGQPSDSLWPEYFTHCPVGFYFCNNNAYYDAQHTTLCNIVHKMLMKLLYVYLICMNHCIGDKL